MYVYERAHAPAEGLNSAARTRRRSAILVAPEAHC